LPAFQLNLEVTLICYAPSVVADLRQVEARNLSRSKAVNLEEWETRSNKEKLFIFRHAQGGLVH
jgi:phosphatidylserine/phosphatidylglycerophosphate/cardiolipin synthase-like enzyme